METDGGSGQYRSASEAPGRESVPAEAGEALQSRQSGQFPQFALGGGKSCGR